MDDLTLYESGNGGDLLITDNDIDQTSSLFNNIYIALFGGNAPAIEDADEDRIQGMQRFDYWQNELFFGNANDQKLISETETHLMGMAITSESLRNLLSVVESDLSYLTELGELSVNIESSLERITIFVRIQETNNSSSRTYSFIWDSTKSEVITAKEI